MNSYKHTVCSSGRTTSTHQACTCRCADLAAAQQATSSSPRTTPVVEAASVFNSLQPRPRRCTVAQTIWQARSAAHILSTLQRTAYTATAVWTSCSAFMQCTPCAPSPMLCVLCTSPMHNLNCRCCPQLPAEWCRTSSRWSLITPHHLAALVRQLDQHSPLTKPQSCMRLAGRILYCTVVLAWPCLAPSCQLSSMAGAQTRQRWSR